jgi:predicted Zn finger-like uncharacterized protein
MILACPSCGASFRIDADKLGARGRTVRCSKCKHTWHASADDARRDGTSQGGDAPGAGAQAPAGSPPPVTGDGPEPGDAQVLHTQAGAAESPARPAGDDGGVRDFESTLRAARYRPYEHDAAEARGPAGGVVFGWILLGLVLLGIAAGGWAFREQVVAQVPQAAQIYELAGVEVPALGAGLELRDVTRTRRLVDGRSLLVISGRMVNTTDRVRAVPALEVALYDAAGDRVAHWRFAADTARLEPGRAASFETRRGDTPETAREFALSFAAPEGAPE